MPQDELQNGELFYSLREAQVVIENWRRESNTILPHSSLGYRPLARETIMPADPACVVGVYGRINLSSEDPKW